MNIEIKLDALCTDSVTVLTTKVFEDNGDMYRMSPHARAYYNHKLDRTKLKEDVPDPYYSAVMQIWGDTPTIEFNGDEDELD